MRQTTNLSQILYPKRAYEHANGFWPQIQKCHLQPVLCLLQQTKPHQAHSPVYVTFAVSWCRAVRSKGSEPRTRGGLKLSSAWTRGVTLGKSGNTSSVHTDRVHREPHILTPGTPSFSPRFMKGRTQVTVKKGQKAGFESSFCLTSESSIRISACSLISPMGMQLRGRPRPAPEAASPRHPAAGPAPGHRGHCQWRSTTFLNTSTYIPLPKHPLQRLETLHFFLTEQTWLENCSCCSLNQHPAINSSRSMLTASVPASGILPTHNRVAGFILRKAT